MSTDISPPRLSMSYLVDIRPEPAGLFTARLVGSDDLQATAPTREDAVDQLRSLILDRLDSGTLEWIEVSRENPLMRWFGHAKDDPTFPEYLEEIRKFREEIDRRENSGSDQSKCSDTSLTPTTCRFSSTGIRRWPDA